MINKNITRASKIVLLLTSLLVFLSIVFAFIVTTLFKLNTFSSIIVFIILSVISGLIFTSGLSFFIPILKENANIFRRTLRFENFTNPLIMRLSYEAPGTFHHSINVSILAQKAAKSIGANSLLVRIAAYYHDIGKLENPTLYIENQSGEEIPKTLDSKDIKNKAKKIISHVKAGIKIAVENHIPEEIIDLISQHHGTTQVLFFYEQAKERGLKVKKTDFCYDGPIPQTKEAAILMCADSIEAAARAIPNLTIEKIESIVSSTIEDKFIAKQLKNSELSQSDIQKVKSSFISTLSHIYHQRIINPDLQENE